MSRFLRGEQGADVDELDAMAQVFDHTLIELLDLRSNPKEQALLDAYRKLRPGQRPFAIQVLEQMIPPSVVRGRTRGRNGE